MKLIAALLLFSSESRADFLSDLFNSQPPASCECSCETQNQDYIQTDGEPEHFSWELGTPDNLTETEVIVLTQDENQGFND